MSTRPSILHRTPRRRAPGAALLLVGLATVALGKGPKAPVSLDGVWTGTIATRKDQAAGTASLALSQSARALTGTITLDVPGAAGVFDVTGAVHGAHVALKGSDGRRHLRWKGRRLRGADGWRGPLVEKGLGTKMHGMLSLARDTTTGPSCGNDYFASDVLPKVMEPICAQCHVPGGQAQAATFRVAPGNARATAASAAKQVDPLDPPRSKLVTKPRGDLSHGGGTRIAPGGSEEQILLTWLAQVTAPGCDLGIGPRGGTGADLYAEHCASCHGADARGLDGRPDIHCNRDVSDAVRNGRSGPSGDMDPFPTLTDGEIAKIQEFLAGLCPVGGATGAELFASNCATCHGGDATGTPKAPNIRCATRAPDAMRVGRGTSMPAFPAVTDPEIALIDAFLVTECTAHGRQGADLYAGNCSTCHGTDAAGGTSGLGVHGPDIQCTGAGDYDEKIRFGSDDMPAFPALGPGDVTAIVVYVQGTLCQDH